MAVIKRKVSVANPTRSKSNKSGKRPMSAQARREFAERMAKYRSKGKTVAKAKNPQAKKTKKRNPTITTTHSRKRNGAGEAAGSVKTLAVEAGTALLAMVATRQLPQLALGAKNTGPVGYAANAATVIACYFAAKSVVSKRAGHAAAIGGGLYLIDRLLTEKFSPVGQFLALTGVGDATAAHTLEGIHDSYLVSPTVRDMNGNPIIPREITDASMRAYQAANPATSPAKLGYTPDRFARTYSR